MHKKLRIFPIGLSILLFSSCASNYKPIKPESLEFHNQTTTDDIDFSYHYDVLTETRNKKYAKHEIKNQVRLVAVRITNHTGHDINPMSDALFVINRKAVYPMDQKLARDQMKQGVPIYLLYLLFTPLSLNTNSTNTDGTTKTNSFPAGLIIGPGLTAANMIVAGSANKQFTDELETYSLYKQLKNGQTIYGLVAFKDISADEITLKLK